MSVPESQTTCGDMGFELGGVAWRRPDEDAVCPSERLNKLLDVVDEGMEDVNQLYRKILRITYHVKMHTNTGNTPNPNFDG